MIFGFPDIERVPFKNNFLRTVTFQYVFDSLDVISHKEYISSTLSQLFPRITDGKNISYEITAANGQTPIIKSSSEVNGIVLLSANGLSRINFMNNSVAFTIIGNAYKRFEEVLPVLTCITELLNKLGVTTIKRTSIRKVNIVTFTTPTNNISGVFEDLFSPGIVNAVEAFPQPESLKQNMHSTVFNRDNYRLNINYGVPEFDNTRTPLTGSVVIDIDLIQNNESNTSQIISNTSMLNKEVYNVFSWMISDKMKTEIMGYE